MFVPPIVATLVVYGALIVVQSLPSLNPNSAWLQHLWLSLPLSLVRDAVPVTLFVAVFAINEKRAILVPICGVFAIALIPHYLFLLGGQETVHGFGHVLLRDLLWSTIKYALPVALLVAGLAMVAARWWAPRIDRDPSRFVIPSIKPALILFAVTAVINFAMTYEQSRGVYLQYAGTILQPTVADYSVIAMCAICAVALQGWTAVLPLVIVGETFAVFMLQPGGCVGDAGGLGGTCWDLIWPFLRPELFALVGLFVISIVAGALARDEGEPAPDPDPDPEVALET
jgi:hypothetical protein